MSNKNESYKVERMRMLKSATLLLLFFSFLLIACTSGNNDNQPTIKKTGSIEKKPVELKAKFTGLTKHYKWKGIKIATALVNNSFSELLYLNFSCSWDMAYTTNLKQSRIQGDGCNKNVPKIYKLKYKEFEGRDLTILFDSTFTFSNQPFRIGFHLAPSNSLPYHITSMFSILNDSSNIIWSNPIQL